MNFDQELPTHQAPHANIQCFHGGDEAEIFFAAREKELEALKGILQMILQKIDNCMYAYTQYMISICQNSVR